MMADSPLDDQFVWFNGSVQRAGDVRISPFDRGFLVGEGAFETMLSVDGDVIALDRHLERLRSGCELLSIAVPDADVVARGIAEVLEKNGLTTGRARVRLTMSGGPAPLGAHFESAVPTVVIAAMQIEQTAAPATLVSVPFTRNERGALVGVKAISYAENFVALEYARNQGATDVVIANCSGNLAEGAISNMYMVVEGAVVTPPLSSGCLPGVTRERVIDLCEREGIPLREESIPVEQFLAAQEAFITGSTRGVQAVAEIDGRKLMMSGDSLTAKLQRIYERELLS